MSMPNKRMIHTKIWVSKQVNSLKPLERLLYIGMITMADDDGRLRGDGVYLRHNFFPFDKIGPIKVERMRDRIEEVGLIIVYEVNDNVYISHPKWNDHQTLKKDRYKTYGFPPPPGDNTETDAEQSDPQDKEREEIIREVKKNKEKISEGKHPEDEKNSVKKAIIEGMEDVSTLKKHLTDKFSC